MSMAYTPRPMTLESALLLLLVALVAIAFYCVQRTLFEILRTLKLIHAKTLNVAAFLKPDIATETATKMEPQGEPHEFVYRFIDSELPRENANNPEEWEPPKPPFK